jgi:hypothetical protein
MFEEDLEDTIFEESNDNRKRNLDQHLKDAGNTTDEFNQDSRFQKIDCSLNFEDVQEWQSQL